MKKKGIGIAGILGIVFFASVCFAEYELSPQYNNKGVIGSQTQNKYWRLMKTNDLDMKGAIIVDADSRITPYGTQFPPGVVTVNSYTQLTALGGASVYVLDLTAGNEFRIDVDAIYASTLPTTTTGVTSFSESGFPTSGISVIGVVPTVTNSEAKFKLTKWGTTGVTPIYLWVPHTSAVTPECVLEAVYPVDTGSGETVYNSASSVSDYPIYEPRDSKTYQLVYDSGESIYVTDIHHRKPLLH